jgi:hypothetical protein
MRATKVKIGDVFGRLTVKERLGSRRGYGIVWRCECVCGGVKEVATRYLSGGDVKSCGCLRKGRTPNSGNTKISLHPLVYNSWKSLRQRCCNPNATGYRYYGGRGIKVCERWKNSFDNFLEDMGNRPGKEYSIERKDNNKGYEPGNCVWATKVEQMNNRKNNYLIDVDGVNKTVGQWAKEIGEHRCVFYNRKRRGYSDEDIVSVPVRDVYRRDKVNLLVKKKAVELCLSGVSVREVREMLCNEFGQSRVPGERAIQGWVKERRENTIKSCEESE